MPEAPRPPPPPPSPFGRDPDVSIRRLSDGKAFAFAELPARHRAMIREDLRHGCMAGEVRWRGHDYGWELAGPARPGPDPLDN